VVRESGAASDAHTGAAAARKPLPLVTPPSPAPAAEATTAIDPVCKMTVTIATARHVAELDGRSWYFCCGGCKTKFLAAPATYQPDLRAGLAQ
jgi:YHS domain-containing protein